MDDETVEWVSYKQIKIHMFSRFDYTLQCVVSFNSEEVLWLVSVQKRAFVVSFSSGKTFRDEFQFDKDQFQFRNGFLW